MKTLLHFKYLLIIVLCTTICTSLSAQVTPKTKVAKNAFNPNLVKTFLSKFSGKNVKASVAEAKEALGYSLSIIDDKKYVYKLSSYQFVYTRWGPVEDEATKEVTQKSTLSADRFTVTPLPEIWLKNIFESLHSGEELYFYDIIAFDKEGKRFFAPEIKIVIQ